MDGLNQLDKELTELKGFIADLKADRAAQKEKEKRESWTKYTSMSLVFIAVLAAIATQWAGKYSSRAVAELNNATFYQAQASDKWTDYDTKSIKQNLYEAVSEITPKTDSGGAASPSVDSFKKKIAKYDTDKAGVMKEARDLEDKRDKARDAAKTASQHGGGMGTSIAIFQIGIALGSICLVTKKRPLWYLAIGFATVATVQMIYVWMR